MQHKVCAQCMLASFLPSSSSIQDGKRSGVPWRLSPWSSSSSSLGLAEVLFGFELKKTQPFSVDSPVFSLFPWLSICPSNSGVPRSQYQTATGRGGPADRPLEVLVPRPGVLLLLLPGAMCFLFWSFGFRERACVFTGKLTLACRPRPCASGWLHSPTMGRGREREPQGPGPAQPSHVRVRASWGIRGRERSV